MTTHHLSAEEMVSIAKKSFVSHVKRLQWCPPSRTDGEEAVSLPLSDDVIAGMMSGLIERIGAENRSKIDSSVTAIERITPAAFRSHVFFAALAPERYWWEMKNRIARIIADKRMSLTDITTIARGLADDVTHHLRIGDVASVVREHNAKSTSTIADDYRIALLEHLSILSANAITSLLDTHSEKHDAIARFVEMLSLAFGAMTHVAETCSNTVLMEFERDMYFFIDTAIEPCITPREEIESTLAKTRELNDKIYAEMRNVEPIVSITHDAEKLDDDVLQDTIQRVYASSRSSRDE